MMGEMKPLPCPFCGSELYIRSGVNPYGHCRTEGCHANRAQVVCLDDPVQVAAWNRRTPPTTQGGEGKKADHGPRPTPYALMERRYRAAQALAAAPPAPASDHVGEGDVPRDEQGRSALEIIRDHNRAHPQRTPTSKAMPLSAPRDPRAPLLGPPSDMLVSKVLLDRLPDMGPAEADTLAVAINDALAAALHPSAEGGADKT